MAELPHLPLHTDALIADTTHMSAEVFGAYVRILIAMWRNGAQLPDNDRELARITGMTLKRWNRARREILNAIDVSQGVLRQKRLTATWEEVQRIRLKRVAASQERWRRNHFRNSASADPHAHAYANGYSHAYANNDAKGMHALHSTWDANQNQNKNITSTSFVAAREGLATSPSVRPPDPSPQIEPGDSLAVINRKLGWSS